jgi:hypothetical protein
MGRAFAALSLVTLGVSTAHAALIVSPSGASASSTFSASFDIGNTIDQSGLSTGFISGVTDFDTYLSGSPTHTSTASGNEWFTAQGVTSATVTYDMGSALALDRLALWNEEFSGFGTGDISISGDGISFTGLGTINPIDSPAGSDYGAQVFNLGDFTAQFIRFDISGCPQPDGDPSLLCGIGEVAFATSTDGGNGQPTPVPAPATLLLFGLGLAGLGFGLRRR